jgi:hypothetical protein
LQKLKKLFLTFNWEIDKQIKIGRDLIIFTLNFLHKITTENVILN